MSCSRKSGWAGDLLARLLKSSGLASSTPPVTDLQNTLGDKVKCCTALLCCINPVTDALASSILVVLKLTISSPSQVHPELSHIQVICAATAVNILLDVVGGKTLQHKISRWLAICNTLIASARRPTVLPSTVYMYITNCLAAGMTLHQVIHASVASFKMHPDVNRLNTPGPQLVLTFAKSNLQPLKPMLSLRCCSQ